MVSFYNIKSLGDSVDVVITLAKEGKSLNKKDKVSLYNYFRSKSGYILCKDNILFYGTDTYLLDY